MNLKKTLNNLSIYLIFIFKYVKNVVSDLKEKSNDFSLKLIPGRPDFDSVCKN